jgi:hypothetical protein
MRTVVGASLLAIAAAQDPANGWMAYAVGGIPSQYERITKLEMTWTVGEAPSHNNAFYSPWFGMDPADNLNLVQPVNPWEGSGWQMYTEYYQWSPSHNSNSKAYNVQPGQTLQGTVVYQPSSDSYELTQTIVETQQSSSQVVKCQSGKKYVIPYVVYEKEWTCSDYPPDGKVSFRNIIVECDGVDCTQSVNWQAKVKDSNCGMAAHVESGAKATADNEISITWNTNMKSRFDNWTQADLIQHNAQGWGKEFARVALERLQVVV